MGFSGPRPRLQRNEEKKKGGKKERKNSTNRRNSYMTLKPVGILPLPTTNRRRGTTEGQHQWNRRRENTFFNLPQAKPPSLRSHTGVINSDFKCYKNKIKEGSRCLPLFMFGLCVRVCVCMCMPCMCQCPGLRSSV